MYFENIAISICDYNARHRRRKAAIANNHIYAVMLQFGKFIVGVFGFAHGIRAAALSRVCPFGFCLLNSCKFIVYYVL